MAACALLGNQMKQMWESFDKSLKYPEVQQRTFDVMCVQTRLHCEKRVADALHTKDRVDIVSVCYDMKRMVVRANAELSQSDSYIQEDSKKKHDAEEVMTALSECLSHKCDWSFIEQFIMEPNILSDQQEAFILNGK